MERDQLTTLLTIAHHAPTEEGRNQVFRCMRAMEEERQETCIHCRSVWYAIHYKDGVCHGCQQKRLPGRSELEAQRRQIARVRFWLVKLPIWTTFLFLIFKLAC